MPDALGLPGMDEAAATRTDDAPGKKLAVMPTPPARETRPITNLGRVFGQFAELQQQITEQVGALEDSVHHQKQDIAAVMAQLPEMRERINWLIAGFYEQSKQDESLRKLLCQQQASIDALTNTVQNLQEAQRQWKEALDEAVQALLRIAAVKVHPL